MLYQTTLCQTALNTPAKTISFAFLGDMTSFGCSVTGTKSQRNGPHTRQDEEEHTRVPGDDNRWAGLPERHKKQASERLRKWDFIFGPGSKTFFQQLHIRVHTDIRRCSSGKALLAAANVNALEKAFFSCPLRKLDALWSVEGNCSQTVE